MQNRTVKQIVDVSIPKFQEERVQQLTVKQTVDVPVQRIMESIAEVSQFIHVDTNILYAREGGSPSLV